MAEREIMGDAFGPGSSPKPVEPQERLDAAHSIPIARVLKRMLSDALFHLDLDVFVMESQVDRLERFGKSTESLNGAIERTKDFIAECAAQGIVTEGGDALAAPGAAQPRVEPDGGAGAP